MFGVATQHQPGSVVDHTPLLHSPGPQQLGSVGAEATARTLLSSLSSPMERSAAEYSQSGLPSPYPSSYVDARSEASSADHASAAQYATQQQQQQQQQPPPPPPQQQQQSQQQQQPQQHQQQQEVRPSSSYPTPATATSDYSVYPQSARSSSFHEHLQRPYHPASTPGGSSGGMAQTPTNPSIAAPSPTYAHGQYSPYAPPSQDMSHGYPHSGGLYAQPRPDWTGYSGQPTPITPSHHVFPQTPTSAAPQARPNQVYSFVPIPGAQQHKRPRRRYEEIERMYKCGWNGCEKAYGTLNHLNAHVTMQSHGQKRTPEEFKEIRKEWKARKKEEEAQRKAEEERQRQAAAAAVAQNGGAGDGQGGPDGGQPATTYPGSRAVQLPPIGYQPNQYPAPPPAGVQQPLPEYGSNYMHSYPPTSPYGPPGQQMYGQRQSSLQHAPAGHQTGR